MKCKKIIFFIFFVLLSQAARSQSREIQSLLDMPFEDLLNIQVSTASKYEEDINQAPGIVTVISGQEIEGFAAQNLGQILNRVVGAYFISANVWTDNLVFFRGQAMTPYNNHTLILLNGRPVRDPISGGLNSPVFAAFPVDAIDRIEVIRGPGSVLYGSCAYSGIINIILKDIKTDGHELGANLTYGTYSTLSTGLTGMLKKGDFSGTFGFSYLGDRGPEYDFTDYNNLYASARFDRKTMGLAASMNYKNASLNVYYGSFNPYSLSGSQNAWSDQDPHKLLNHDKIFIDAGYLMPVNQKIKINYNFTYNRHAFQAEDDDVVAASDFLIEGMISYDPAEQLNIIAGAVFSRDSYSAARLIDGNTVTSSFYTQLSYYLSSSFKLIGGIQYNKIENIDGHFSPRMGFVYNMTSDIGIKGLHSTAYRKAYPLETSFNHPLFRGNLEISPELITTTEFQLFHTAERLQSSVTIFHSRMSNIIIRRAIPDVSIAPPLPPYYLKYFNGGTHDWWGFELEKKLTAVKNLFITWNVMYQINKNDEGIENAALHSNLIAKGGILYSDNRASLGIYGSYFSKPHPVSIINPNVINSNPHAERYVLVSCKLSYRISDAVKMALNGDNLFDYYVRYPEYTSRGVNTLIPLSKGRIMYATLSLTL